MDAKAIAQQSLKRDDALKTISMYVLPIYTIDGHQYVKFEHALFLKQTAKDALK